MQITLISGTNRPQSYTRKVSNYIANQLSQAGAKVELLDLVDLPPELFLPEAYAQKPKSFDRFRDAILNTDGIFSVIPEYNGGAPGVYKYLIDMLPFPQSLQKKPAAFVGVADGRFGAVRAVEHMMQIFAYRNAYLFSERAFLMNIVKTFDETTGPKDEIAKKVLHSQIENFISFVSKFKS